MRPGALPVESSPAAGVPRLPAGSSIVLVGNYPRDQQESMLRFSAMLQQGLAQLGHPPALLHAPVFFGARCQTGHGLGKWIGYLDKYLLFPFQLRRLARRHRADRRVLVHLTDHSNAVYTRYLQGVPNLVTCHDLLAVRSARGEFPQNPVRWSGQQLQRAILRGLNRAGHVVADSQATFADVRRLTSLPPEKISRVHVGLNYPYTPMPADEARRRVAVLLGRDNPPPFILHVGGNQWYKNRRGVLQIFRELHRLVPNPPLLVLAGKPLPPDLLAGAEWNLTGKFVQLNHCDNEDLRALYSLAELLLFPSLAEGFGWPPVEAQACGCRVVVSQVEPLPEVAGPSAFLVDPHAAPAAAVALRDALAEPPAARHARREAGLQNIRRFAPQTMVQAYLTLYAQLLAAS